MGRTPRQISHAEDALHAKGGCHGGHELQEGDVAPGNDLRRARRRVQYQVCT